MYSVLNNVSISFPSSCSLVRLIFYELLKILVNVCMLISKLKTKSRGNEKKHAFSVKILFYIKWYKTNGRHHGFFCFCPLSVTLPLLLGIVSIFSLGKVTAGHLTQSWSPRENGG